MYSCSIFLLNYLFININSKSQSFASLDSFLNQFTFNANVDPSILREISLNPTEVMNLYGYKGENHSVTTDDGYILTVLRIPDVNPNSIPILLLHGSNGRSDQFFINGHTSPAFILADAGFDVWLANFRGTSFTSHKKYTTKDKQFWDFSWQEMAQQDLPHSIDYILNFTKHEKIILSGHSMGTTVGFALLSSQPSYNHKVAGFLPLAPVAYSNYPPNFFQIYKHIPSFQKLYTETNFEPRQILYLDGWKLQLVQSICASKTFYFICELQWNLFGYDPYLYNKTRAPIFVSRSDGASIKTFAHVAQIRTLKGMHQYNYGKEMNQKRYNSSMPPAYNLSKISAPVVLFHGANDVAADPLDVALIGQKLPNLQAKELIPDPRFSHMDFMFAMNMKRLVYDKFIEHAKNMWN
uniref:Lipase n=1 Tax=Strigamia maritima TaxID=126957 RepID=T1JNX6_STRMM